MTEPKRCHDTIIGSNIKSAKITIIWAKVSWTKSNSRLYKLKISHIIVWQRYCTVNIESFKFGRLH